MIERGAAAGDDAFFDRRAGGRQSVLDAVLLFFQFGLGGRADLDDGDAAGQLGQPLLQLLFVVVAVRLLDLRLDLGDAALDGSGSALAFDDGGLVLGDGDALGRAEDRSRPRSPA